MKKYRSPVSAGSKYLESKKLKESANEFAFKEITGKTWDEYVKGILEKLKTVVEGYEDEDRDNVVMILEVMIDEATELADGSFEDYQKLAILHLFEEKIDDLETLNKVLKDFGIEEIKDDAMDESVNLKEDVNSYPCKFFKFDDVLDYDYDDDYDDDEPKLKQIDVVTDWLQELIDCGYLDDMYDVWFEDFEGTAAAVGISVKSMPEILAKDPDAKFGYSYGSPDTRFCVSNAADYVREVDYDDDDYDDEDYDDYDDED